MRTYSKLILVLNLCTFVFAGNQSKLSSFCRSQLKQHQNNGQLYYSSQVFQEINLFIIISFNLWITLEIIIYYNVGYVSGYRIVNGKGYRYYSDQAGKIIVQNIDDQSSSASNQTSSDSNKTIDTSKQDMEKVALEVQQMINNAILQKRQTIQYANNLRSNLLNNNFRNLKNMWRNPYPVSPNQFWNVPQYYPFPWNSFMPNLNFRNNYFGKNIMVDGNGNIIFVNEVQVPNSSKNTGSTVIQTKNLTISKSNTEDGNQNIIGGYSIRINGNSNNIAP